MSNNEDQVVWLMLIVQNFGQSYAKDTIIKLFQVYKTHVEWLRKLVNPHHPQVI